MGNNVSIFKFHVKLYLVFHKLCHYLTDSQTLTILDKYGPNLENYG